MKKLLLVSIICLLVFSLATLALAEEKVHLKFWTCQFITAIESEGKEDGWYEGEVIEEFEEMYPNVEIELQILPWAQGQEKLEMAIASDIAPDIFFHSDGALFDRVDRGLVLSFDEVYPMWEKKRLADYAKSACFRDGKMMILPWGLVAVAGPTINGDLAKKAGAYDLLPLDDPYRRWSHEEFVAFLRKCKVLIEEGIYPYAIPSCSSVGDMNTREIMVQFGMEVFNKEGTKCIMNSPEGVKALEWIVMLNDEGLLVPHPESFTAFEITDAFFGNKLVGYYGSGIGFVLDEQWASRVPNQILVQLPTIDGGDPKCRAGLLGFIVFDNGDLVKARYAKLFCKFYATKDPLIASGFPPYKDIELDYENEEINFMARNSIFAGDYFGMTNPYYSMLRESFYPELQAAFLHIKTPQEALDDLCDIMDKLMQE